MSIAQSPFRFLQVPFKMLSFNLLYLKKYTS